MKISHFLAVPIVGGLFVLLAEAKPSYALVTFNIGGTITLDFCDQNPGNTAPIFACNPSVGSGNTSGTLTPNATANFSGSFVYNQGTNTASSVNITWTPTSGLNGPRTLVSAVIESATGGQVNFTRLTGAGGNNQDDTFYANFSTDLTSFADGGTYFLNLDNGGFCYQGPNLGFGNNSCGQSQNSVLYTGTGDNIVNIPSPLSAFATLPFVGILALRRRYANLG